MAISNHYNAYTKTTLKWNPIFPHLADMSNGWLFSRQDCIFIDKRHNWQSFLSVVDTKHTKYISLHWLAFRKKIFLLGKDNVSFEFIEYWLSILSPCWHQSPPSCQAAYVAETLFDKYVKANINKSIPQTLQWGEEKWPCQMFGVSDANTPQSYNRLKSSLSVQKLQGAIMGNCNTFVMQLW